MSSDAVTHVIDDDEAVRQSIEFLLRAAKIKVRTYESAGAFLETVGGIAAGCIVTDVRMPEMSGIDLLRRLKELRVTLPVIVITGHGDVPLAVEAMKAGAADFIEKPFDDDTILGAIRTALASSQSGDRRSTERAEIEERLGSLSQRERQVLEGLVAGQPNKIIAHNLGISPRTVEIYRANVMTKMKAPSLPDLVRLALTAGLFE
jgi:two-component system, LuxR family, response regulator FixJ